MVLNLNRIMSVPYSKDDVISAIVYSTDSQNIETVMVDGKILLQNSKLISINEEALIKDCEKYI